MIAFAVLCTITIMLAVMFWVAICFVGKNTTVEVDNALVGVGLLLSLGLLFVGVWAGLDLRDETRPHYFPVLINVPVLAEKPLTAGH